MGSEVDFDVVVIGGGIVGLASAYKIGLNNPKLSIAVFEKENELAAHQTGHNSGVIHSGLYYKPGSAKAKTCAVGRKELVEFAEEYGIAYDICGKIIVATHTKEMGSLETIFNRAVENGIERVEKINADEIKDAEPSCAGIAGIRVPCTGIIDFTEVVKKLGDLVEAQSDGNKILRSYEITGFERHDFFTKVLTDKESFNAKYIINCGGLYCDRIAKMSGVDPKMRIIPFRGDYYELTEGAKDKVNNLIYPVPDPAMPFLGVHFTRMIDGSVECGPNAVFSFKREGYGKMDFDLKDTLDSVLYMGLWKMFLKNWKYGFDEYVRAFSKKLFLSRLQRLVPSLKAEEIRPSKAGVRAQALGPRGELLDDFKIIRHENFIHVLNAPSPAATASLAIGEHINKMATDYFKLKD